RFQLGQFRGTPAISLSNTNARACHGKTFHSVRFALLFTLLAPLPALLQLSRIPGMPQTPLSSGATLERPDFSVRIPRPNAPPGVLATQEPVKFEGASVEKDAKKYILHNGFITDCTRPNPWWKLYSNRMDITPDDHAVASNAIYHLRNVPLFYLPVFYKSLKK